jgi:hypothetical protein
MRVKFIAESRRSFEKLTSEERLTVLERLRRTSPPAPRRLGPGRFERTREFTVLVAGIASVQVRSSARELLVVSIQRLSGGEEASGGQEP